MRTGNRGDVAATRVRTVGVVVVAATLTTTLSACGAHARSSHLTVPAAVTGSATTGGTADTDSPGTTPSEARVSPSTATIGQDDVNELQAALSDAESLTNDVESDMAQDSAT